MTKAKAAARRALHKSRKRKARLYKIYNIHAETRFTVSPTSYVWTTPSKERLLSELVSSIIKQYPGKQLGYLLNDISAAKYVPPWDKNFHKQLIDRLTTEIFERSFNLR